MGDDEVSGPLGIGGNRYRPIRELGRGGFGRVMLAQDLRLDRQVAVKVLHLSEAKDLTARFDREAKVTAQLRHPNIVEVYDYGVEEDGTAFIVYEYVPGRNLEAVASDSNSGRLPQDRVQDWGAQLAEALAVAHEAGVVHRDIKPGNILVRESGQPVLCDFGIAFVGSEDEALTQEGIILGSPTTIAPEVIMGAEPDARADVFGLAATLFLMAYGQSVYGTENPGEIVERVVRGEEAVIPREFRGKNPALEGTLLYALRFDPEARTPDAKSFAAAIAATAPLSAPPPTPIRDTVQVTRPAAPPPRSLRPRWLVAGGLALLCGIGFLVGGPGRGTSGTPPPSSTPPPAASPPRSPFADLREKYAELARLHGSKGGVNLPPAHIGPARASLLDPRLALRFRRVLELLKVHSRSPLAPGEEFVGLVQRVMAWLGPHLIRDLQELAEPDLETHPSPQRISEMRTAMERKDSLEEDLLRFTDALLEEAAPGLLFEGALVLRASFRNTGLELRLEQGLARLPSSRSPIERLYRALFLVEAASMTLHSRGDCDTSGELLKRILRQLEKASVVPDARLSGQEARLAWQGIGRLARFCQERGLGTLLRIGLDMARRSPAGYPVLDRKGTVPLEILRRQQLGAAPDDETRRLMHRMWWLLFRERQLDVRNPEAMLPATPGRGPKTRHFDAALERAIKESRGEILDPDRVLLAWGDALEALRLRLRDDGQLEAAVDDVRRLFQEGEPLLRELLAGKLPEAARNRLRRGLITEELRLFRPLSPPNLLAMVAMLSLSRPTVGPTSPWIYRQVRLHPRGGLEAPERDLLELVERTMVLTEILEPEGDCYFLTAQSRALRDPFQDERLDFFQGMVRAQEERRLAGLSLCLAQCAEAECLDDEEKAMRELNVLVEGSSRRSRDSVCDLHARVGDRFVANPGAGEFTGEWSARLTELCR